VIQNVLLLIGFALKIWGPLPPVDLAALLTMPPPSAPEAEHAPRPARYSTPLSQLQERMASKKGEDEFSVLILGDSHSMGYFGRVLHRMIRKQIQGNVVMVSACGRAEAGHLDGTYAHCGVIIRDENNKTQVPKGCRKNPCLESDGESCSKHDCRPRKVDEYLKALQPDVTLVQLGGNNVWRGSRKKGWPIATKRMHELADIILKHGSRCMWVTPPDSSIRSDKLEDAFASMYETELRGKCTVFNSRPEHRPFLNYSVLARELRMEKPDHDGLHYGWLGDRGRKAQRQWAKEIVIDLVLNSIASLKNKAPQL